METPEELREIINTALDNEYWTAPNIPKKCVLHQCYDLVNLSGYITEIYDRDNEKDHCKTLERRCVILSKDHVKLIMKGLWI